MRAVDGVKSSDLRLEQTRVFKIVGGGACVLMTGLACAGPIDVVNSFLFNLPEPAFCNEEAESLTPVDFDLAFEPPN